MQHLNNWDGKPRLIQQVIGKPPIFAAGNSNGDQQMLQYVGGSGGLALMVHHTDAEREWAYDRQSAVGRLDRGLNDAKAKGWLRVDMARDWNTVFPERP